MLITLFSILDYLFIYYLLSLFLFIILNIRYFLVYYEKLSRSKLGEGE